MLMRRLLAFLLITLLTCGQVAQASFFGPTNHGAGFIGAGVAGFDPDTDAADIGTLLLRLQPNGNEGSETGTQYDVTTGAVTAWYDTVAAANATQSSGSNRPAYVPGAIAGFPAMNVGDTAGATRFMNVNALNILNNRAAFTVHMLLNIEDTNNYMGLMRISENGSSGDPRFQIELGDGTNRFLFKYLQKDSDSLDNGFTGNNKYTPNTDFVLSVSVNVSTGTITAYNNGTEIYSDTFTTDGGNTDASNSAAFYLGNWYGSGTFATDHIAEVLIYDGAQDADTVGDVVQYFNYKYSLAEFNPDLTGRAIVFVGDSVSTDNQGLSGLDRTEQAGYRLRRMLSSNDQLIELGHSTLSAANAESELGAVIDGITWPEGASEKILVVALGKQDCVVDGTGGFDAAADVISFVNARQTHDSEIRAIIAPPITGPDSTASGKLKDFTYSINDPDNTTTNEYEIAAWSVDPYFSVVNEVPSSYTTYYNADRTHPTATGAYYLAKIIYEVLEPISDPYLQRAGQHWRKQIPATATLLPIQLEEGDPTGISFTEAYYDDLNYRFTVTDSTPIINLKYPTSFDERSTGTIDQPFNIQAETSTVVPDASPPSTPNYPAVIYNSDHGSFQPFNAFCLTPAGNANAWAYYVGSHGGTGLVGGDITSAELTNGINHAIALNLPGNWLYYSGGVGRTSPAFLQDSNASTSYTGTMPELTMGSWLGVDKSVTAASLGLTTAKGAKILAALQTYGAYVVDTISAGTGVGLGQNNYDAVSFNVADNAEAELEDPDVAADNKKIFAVLQVVSE